MLRPCLLEYKILEYVCCSPKQSKQNKLPVRTHHGLYPELGAWKLSQNRSHC